VDRCEVGKIKTANLTIAGNGPGSGLAPVRVAYGEYDMGTCFGKRARRGESDAAVGAGDDGDPSVL
jgi:hypothetical protein